MKRKIIIASALALFALVTILTTTISSNQISLSDIEVMVKANQNELMDAIDDQNPGSCCLNGYKSWSTSGDDQLEFKDCWCQNKKGHNPNSCAC
jgi:hypothetical protein